MTFAWHTGETFHNRQMDDSEAGRYWEQNAEAWTRLSRQGYDVYRDLFNTPAFLEMLPEVGGLTGLDLGCGEGHNTRLLAQRGARMRAIDVAPTFVRAQRLPFRDAAFDFATAFMICRVQTPRYAKLAGS